MLCPRCGYVRQEYESAYLEGVCPACGIAYNKWLARQALAAQEHAGPALQEAQLRAIVEAPEPLSIRENLRQLLLHMPSDRHESVFWAHVVFYLVFTLWGWRFILHGMDAEFVGSSILHLVNLPFHEYGHLAFSPFGETMTLLGGSLFQIMLPLLPGGYFLWLRRDNFPASLMLWWCGQNFIDVSVYIADAPVRALPLISGEAGTHDWWYLLAMTDSLDRATAYATLCFAVGVLLLVVSNIWGFTLLRIEFMGRTGLPEGAAGELDQE